MSTSQIDSQDADIVSAKSGIIRINDADMYYEDTGGSGPVVLFSHALLLDSRLFTPQVEALKENYRCISYEHRGQGRSGDARKFAISMDALCADVVELIAKLQLGKVHFCGLSMGGFVGLRLAARHPELIRSLILCSTSADGESFGRLLKYACLNAISFTLGPASVAKPVAAVIYGKSTYTDPSRKEEYQALIRQVGDNRQSIWRAVNGVIFRRSVFEELSKISAPALIIVGEEDLCTVPAKSLRLAKHISGAQIVQVPKAGHAVTLEQPEIVNAEITKFLATLK